jgi:hypothetical protein
LEREDELTDEERVSPGCRVTGACELLRDALAVAFIE